MILAGPDAEPKLKSKSGNKSINADSLFRVQLKHFNIPDSLLTYSTKKSTKTDTSSRYYLITLPGDIIFPVFLNILNKKMAEHNIFATSKSNGNNVFELYLMRRGKKILSARLIQSPLIQRKQGSLAIFVLVKESDIFLLSELDYSPTGIFPIVYAEKINQAKLRALSLGNGGYGVLLDGDIKDVDFKLDFSFQESRFFGALNNIFSYFSGVNLLLLSHTANFYRPSSLARIVKKSAEKSIPVVGTGLLVDLRDTDVNISLNEIMLYAAKLQSEDSGFILIDVLVYLKIKNELLTLKQKGIKMLSVSELTKRAALRTTGI